TRALVALTGSFACRLPLAAPDPIFAPTSSDVPVPVPVPVPDLGNGILVEGGVVLIGVEAGATSRLGAGTGNGVGAGVTALPIGMIPLVRWVTAAGGEVILRGGAIPIASCIALVLSRVTSVPHCTSALCAAVPLS